MTFRLGLTAFLGYKNGSGRQQHRVETSEVLYIYSDMVGLRALVTDTDSSSHQAH